MSKKRPITLPHSGGDGERGAGGGDAGRVRVGWDWARWAATKSARTGNVQEDRTVCPARFGVAAALRTELIFLCSFTINCAPFGLSIPGGACSRALGPLCALASNA